MIARPLVEPFPSPPARRPRRRLGVIVGGVLVLGSIIGALLWVQLTPFGFTRFSLIDGDVVVDLQPGTYLVFEERRGASEPALPPPFTVAVTSKQGDVIAVDVRLRPGTEASPDAYRTPWHEGRAIASFTVTEAGLYHVRTAPLRRGATAGYGPRLGGTVAIGREEATSWAGGWVGALVLCGVPLAVGLGVIALSRRRRPRASRSVPPVGSGSLTAHG